MSVNKGSAYIYPRANTATDNALESINSESNLIKLSKLGFENCRISGNSLTIENGRLIIPGGTAFQINGYYIGFESATSVVPSSGSFGNNKYVSIELKYSGGDLASPSGSEDICLDFLSEDTIPTGDNISHGSKLYLGNINESGLFITSSTLDNKLHYERVKFNDKVTFESYLKAVVDPDDKVSPDNKYFHIDEGDLDP